MSTCKDCIHFDVCYHREHCGADLGDYSICNTFKDKSKVIELPCKVGDKVYYLRYEYHGKMIPIPCTVDSIVYDGRWLKVYGIEERQNMQMWHADDFGKTVFLTREEAQKALGGVEG